MVEFYQFDPVIRKAYEEAVIPFAIYQFADHKVHVLLVTQGLCDLSQMPRDELMDRLENDMYKGVHPQDVYAVAQAALRYATVGGEYNVVYRERIGDTEEYQVIHSVGAHVTMPTGEILAVVRYENITDALNSTENSKMVFESAVEEFYKLDPQATCIVSKEHNTVLYTNDAFRQLLPPVRAYDSGVGFWEYFCGEPSENHGGFFDGLIDQGPQIVNGIERERALVLNVREATWAGEKALVIRADELTDVYIDKLTGLTNQAYFELKAPEFIADIRKHGGMPVCIFYDINDMKMYNARNGYQDGDELLIRVSRVLRDVFGNALISRLSADHYSIIAEDDGLEDRIERVSNAVEMLDANSKTLIKAGVRRIPEGDDVSISTLLDQAKTVCDLIHGNMDQKHKYYDADLERELQERKFIVDHIDEAVRNGEIEVYFQPVVRTLSRELCGFEALARWNSPELGFLMPFRFIPQLEHSHQIHKLDCQVIREICRRYRHLVDQGKTPVPVSFNLSRLDFQMCDMFRFIQDTAEEFSVPHEMLRIEVTETTLSSDDGLIQEAIHQFHEAGYEVWMDDFGSGYSSLNTLKDYHFDQLKIDMVFLSNFTERSKKIIASIVQMAKCIGIHTLVEGVETEEQFDFLNSIGCEVVQGYYFGRPMPFDESISHVENIGIQPESRENAAYYGKAGLAMVHPEEAFAVMEDNGEGFRYVTMNETNMLLLREIGVHSIEEIIEKINQYKISFRNRVMQAEFNGGSISFTFPYHGYYLVIALQILARRQESVLVKLTMSNTLIGKLVRDIQLVDQTEEDDDWNVGPQENFI